MFFTAYLSIIVLITNMTIAEQQIICGVEQNKETLTHFEQGYFFNTYEFHVKNHKEEQLLTFFLKKNDKIITQILLVKERNILKSTSYSPFSFFQNTSLIFIKNLLEYIFNWANLNDIQQIIFKTPPSSYLEKSSEIYELLKGYGFNILLKDVNFYLLVDQQEFRNKIARAERSKLNKCIKSGFLFKETNLDDYAKIYQILKSCRDRKGYEISMNENHLKKMIHAFSQQYKLFVVKNTKGEILAASVAIIVNSRTLYTFYWGDDCTFRKYSPVVFLLEGIYQYCQKHKIQLMDLGTSSLKGKVSEGTFRFKKHLGGNEEEKLIFYKEIMK